MLTLNNYLLSPASQFLNDLIGTIREYVREYAKTLKFHAQARQTIAELGALSTRELSDIGIGRGDIRSIAYGDNTLVRNS